MNELDEFWRQMIAEATRRARTDGRGDVADYLALKASNDALRAAGCRWLFESFVELSDEANRQGVQLAVENENPHRFAADKATMVGSLINFRRGLRSLTIEAGWTRTPHDGFMRGGALARARITHFGISRANAELVLLNSADHAPQWFAVAPDGKRNPISAQTLREHFQLFLN